MLSVIFIKIYFTSHNYLLSKIFETPFTNTNEISDNEDNFDIELSTQQNDIDNENRVNAVNNFAINQDEFNRNVQAKDEQIDNKLFILLYCDLMSDDCNSGARSYDDVIVLWICLTLAQRQYTFNITDNSLESLIKLQSFLMHRLFSFDINFVRKYTVCNKCYS